MTTETEKPANALKPDPKYVHGVDHGIAPDVAVADDGGVHHATTREQDANPLSDATTKTKSQQRPKRHHVVQTGVIRNASVEEVRSVFLDVNNMWKWHWQMERVEVVHEGDPRSGEDDDEDGPVTPMNYEQRVYWYQDTKRESQQADSPRRGGGVSTRPTVQKVVAVRPNAVTLHVERRPPVRRVQVVLSVEAQEDGGTKVSERGVLMFVPVSFLFSFSRIWPRSCTHKIPFFRHTV